jgi:hypothetical protein
MDQINMAVHSGNIIYYYEYNGSGREKGNSTSKLIKMTFEENCFNSMQA